MAIREKALFSSRAEYGVRLMMLLARAHGDGPLPLARVAESELLPLPYLEQLVAPLRRDGLVRSRRGAHGGYELARPPEEITMGEVVRALEGPIRPMICAPEDPAHVACFRGELCSAQLLWSRVRDAVAGALDSTTLAELVPERASAGDLRLATAGV